MPKSRSLFPILACIASLASVACGRDSAIDGVRASEPTVATSSHDNSATSVVQAMPWSPSDEAALARDFPRREAPTLQKPSVKGAVAVIVYRHTYHAFADSYGYDTEILRFYAGVGAAIDRIERAALAEGKEKPLDSYSLERNGKSVRLSGGDERPRSARYETDPLSVSLERDGGKITYIRPAQGKARVDRDGGARDYELWSLASSPHSTETRAGAITRRGQFYAAGGNSWRFAEDVEGDADKAESTVVDAYADAGGFLLRVDGVEAIQESGVWLGGTGTAALLEYWALAECLLGERSYLAPLFARLVMDS